MSEISRMGCIAAALPLLLAAGCRNIDAAREVPKTGPDSVIVLASAKLSSLTITTVGTRMSRGAV